MKMGSKGSWLVVYMCRGRQLKEDVERMLTEEGFLVHSRALERVVSDNSAFELCVLESEEHEARKFLMEKGL